MLHENLKRQRVAAWRNNGNKYQLWPAAAINRQAASRRSGENGRGGVW